MTTHQTRAAAVADALREAILNGQYLSGERLIEVKIAQGLDVSQNTVRDALRILEHEGWVDKNPRHGVYVRSFSVEDAEEICALIGTLETMALRWVIDHLDKTTRADLHALIARTRRLAYAGERGEAFDALLRFHERIGAAAQKRQTTQFLETLFNQIRLLEAVREARSPRTARELDEQIARHDALLKLIDDGDVEAACNIVRALNVAYSRTIREALAP